MLKFGCIGAGNMGEAILRGAFAAGVLCPESAFVFDPDQSKTDRLAADLHIQVCQDLEQLIRTADVLLLAVKPVVCDRVLDAQGALFAGKAVLSIVAARSGKTLAGKLPQDTRILRVMPNTPAMVREGMIVLEEKDTLSDVERAFALALFSAVGKIDHADVRLMDAVTGISGSGPAYVYMFIEALADGGVRAGLPRATACRLAAQTVLGAARMVLETGENPEELKNRVCSPGGTTIEAVAALEACGLRNAVLQAVDACVRKSMDMGK